MTNKTFWHVNHVNNSSTSSKTQSKSPALPPAPLSTSSSSSLSSFLWTTSNEAATLAQSSSTSLSNSKSNNISNTSHIKSNHEKLGVGINNKNVDVGNVLGNITTYAHGIWYQAYDTIGNDMQQHIEEHQRVYNNVRLASPNVVEQQNENMLRPDNNDMKYCMQQQLCRQSKVNNSNNIERSSNSRNSPANNCDIVVVDIEDEQFYEESKPTSHSCPNHMTSSEYLLNGNIRNSRQNVLKATLNPQRQQHVSHVTDGNDKVVNIAAAADDDIVGDNNSNVDDDDDDSLASMETLSDNVSIWIDGEKHWIAGVDEQTTCADLIWALLNYQNGQPENKLNANTTSATYTDCSTVAVFSTKQSNHQPTYRGNEKDMNMAQKPIDNGKVTSTTYGNTTSTTITGNINQSMPKNTKEENCKITENSSSRTPQVLQEATRQLTTTMKPGCNTNSAATTITTTTTVLPCAPVTRYPLPPGITTPAQLTTEYVIVKHYHHCEEYLDGSTKVFDVITPLDSQHRKECELQLRRLAPPPMSVYANNHNATTTTPQLSSLISTDKDSGMGSPVGSARSSKFRRRKHKSSQWLAQANTLHPKLSRCPETANERLLKIIMSQDETIQRQLSLLRDKERQINKIEEEKHRKRERELGKNYLLETYLNGLDEADCEPEHQQDGEEIFIDEPYPTHTTKGSMLATCPAVASNITTKPTLLSEEMITLKNFKPKESKKDKKKKRHKEKLTKDEIKPTTANINKAKDKEEQTRRLHSQDAVNIPGSIVNEEADDGGFAVGHVNKAEIEMQILWWEKVYTLNKQLQKEEEMAAKLHAKIRKQQLKKANQTQIEVQLEIDKLDNSLALQCGSIRRVEANIMATNDQLQKKLQLLERLSLEYLHQEKTPSEESQQNHANEQEHLHEPLPQLQQMLLASPKIHKLSLCNIKTAEEVNKLQKLIAKPNSDLQCPEGNEQMTNQIYATLCEPPNNVAASSGGNEKQPFSEEILVNSAFSINNERHLMAKSTSKTSDSTICTKQHEATFKASIELQQPLVLLEPAEDIMTTIITSASTTTPPLPILLSTPLSAAAVVAPLSSSNTNTMSQVNVLFDKNMLSSLHVQNAKTIKKQMFHAQTTRTETVGTASATTTLALTAATTSLTTTPPMATLPLHQPALTTYANAPKAIEINTYCPKQQPQQSCNSYMPLPTASMASSSYPNSSSNTATTITTTALITSRPQYSHQISSCANQMARQAAVGFGVATSSLVPIQATTMAAATSLKAQSTTISSTSSPSSLMAMNTVDISQLGTLV